MKDNTIHFNIFSQFDGLINCISTRDFGSMKDHGQINYSNINAFLKTLDIDPDRLVLSEQVHGSNCAIINDIPAERLIKDTDGLIAANKNILLGVLTADCIPILFYDSEKKIAGIGHGGFRGLSGHIIKEIIGKFRALGSNVHNLWVGIGPGIGNCCYCVSRDRIAMFQEIIPLDDSWYRKERELFFMDLKRVAWIQLKEEGIPEDHIEVSDICTMHQADRFYSYRKEGDNAGRFISIIGVI